MSRLAHFVLPVLALAVVLITAALQPAAAQATGDGIGLELNKLEQVEGACRAFLVLRNRSAAALDSLDLDLVTFQPDGVIGARFRIELAPVPGNKTIVKSFDFEGVTCEEIERVLLNDVVDCAPVERPACLEALELSSLNRDFFK